MNTEKNNDAGANHKLLKINISDIKLNIIISIDKLKMNITTCRA